MMTEHQVEMESSDQTGQSNGPSVVRTIVVGGLVLFTAFVGWVMASLLVADFSGNGGSRPMTTDEILIGMFPMALLLTPALSRKLCQRFGAMMATIAEFLGVALLAVGGVGITILRSGGFSEDIQVLAIVAGIWAVLGLVLSVSVRGLRT